MAPTTTFAQRMRRSREAKGFTQTQVAKHFGICRASVSQWETEVPPPDSGKKAPTQPKKERFPEIARLYGVDVMWLITGDGTPEGNMTSEEWAILLKFRRLGPEMRTAASRLLDALDAGALESPMKGAS